MDKIKTDELKRLFPNASKSTLAVNQADGVPQSTEPERSVQHEPLEAGQGEKSNPKRIQVSVRSVRKRLIDPDNLTVKYFIDCLRYWNFIPDDTASDIELSVRQEKFIEGRFPKWRPEGRERTEITITYPNSESETPGTSD